MKNFLIVYIAVILANISTLTLYEIYQQYKAKQMINVESFESIDTPVASEPALIPSQQANKKTAELNQLKAKLDKAANLCKYWEKQYDKEPTELNAALRDKACQKVKKLERAMPSAE